MITWATERKTQIYGDYYTKLMKEQSRKNKTEEDKQLKEKNKPETQEGNKETPRQTSEQKKITQPEKQRTAEKSNITTKKKDATAETTAEAPIKSTKPKNKSNNIEKIKSK